MGDVKQLDLGSIGRIAGLMPGSSVLAADDQPGLSSCDCVVASVWWQLCFHVLTVIENIALQEACVNAAVSCCETLT